MIQNFGLIINKSTQLRLEAFINRPSHALLLIGPKGAGKSSIAKVIAGNILNCPTDKLENNSNFKLIQAANLKTISINDIRQAIHFTTLRVTGNKISRLIIIEDSQLMTRQAQNALLKTIEEPPEGTTIILTATNPDLLLPTIISRVQQFEIRKIDDPKTITSYFIDQNYSPKDIGKALLMSGGLIGLMSSLLKNDREHPLYKATTIAHDILQNSSFDRLVLADELGRDRELCADIIFTLGQMATISLARSKQNSVSFEQWYKILKATNLANEQLLTNAQPKLIMLNFMLSI